jgi:hypothetical protein
MHVPQANAFEFFLDFGRNFGRVFHLGIGRDDDILLASTLNGADTAILLDGQINCSHLGNSLKRGRKLSDNLYYIAQLEKIQAFLQSK